jgi:4-amino-4-deoxy-L-arabinose transferase-like glycosyltransferase
VVLAGTATLLWTVLSRQWRAPFRFLHPVTIIVFCVTTLPWYMLCALRNPDFLRVFIWQHNLLRYFTPVFEHHQPFWFYGPILLLGLLPWTPLLAMTLADAAARLRNHFDVQSPSLFLECWALFPLVFFSFSQSKLPGYILPVMPPVVLLVSRGFARSLEGGRRGILWGVGACGALFLFPAFPWLATIIDHNGSREWLQGAAISAAVVAVVGGVIAVFLAVCKQPGAALQAVAILVTVILALSNFTILPQLDSELSSRSLAQQILQADPSGQHVATHNIPKAWRYGLHYYLGRDFPEWTPNSQTLEWIIGRNQTQADFFIHYRLRLEKIGKANSSPVSLFRIMDKSEAAPQR